VEDPAHLQKNEKKRGNLDTQHFELARNWIFKKVAGKMGAQTKRITANALETEPSQTPSLSQLSQQLTSHQHKKRIGWKFIPEKIDNLEKLIAFYLEIGFFQNLPHLLSFMKAFPLNNNFPHETIELFSTLTVDGQNTITLTRFRNAVYLYLMFPSDDAQQHISLFQQHEDTPRKGIVALFPFENGYNLAYFRDGILYVLYNKEEPHFVEIEQRFQNLGVHEKLGVKVDGYGDENLAICGCVNAICDLALSKNEGTTLKKEIRQKENLQLKEIQDTIQTHLEFSFVEHYNNWRLKELKQDVKIPYLQLKRSGWNTRGMCSISKHLKQLNFYLRKLRMILICLMIRLQKQKLGSTDVLKSLSKHILLFFVRSESIFQPIYD